MNSKIIKNVFFYGIGDFIVTGVTAFLFIPLYIKYMTVSEYGVFSILNSNTTLFTYIFQFGIISAFSRIFYIKKAQNAENSYIWNIIYVHIIYSVFLILFILLFQKHIFSSLAPSVDDFKLLGYPVLMGFLTFLPSLYYVYLRIEEKAGVFVFFQLLTVVLISSFLGIYLYLNDINLYSILLSFIITNCILWFVVVFRFLPTFSIKVDIDSVIQTIKFAFPIFITYIAYFFITKYSLIILQDHVSLKEIGLFSLAQQISSIPSLITVAIAKAVQPFLFSSKDEDELAGRAQKFDSNFKLGMIWLVGTLIFSVDFLFQFLLPVSYFPIHNVTKYLLLISLIYNFSIVENSILLYFMKSKVILVITIAGSIVNIALSNLLVGYYSINGIIISMLIAFSLNFILSIYFSGKKIKLNYDILSLFTCLTIIVFYLLYDAGLFFKQVSDSVIPSIVGFTVLSAAVLIIYIKKNHEFRSN